MPPISHSHPNSKFSSTHCLSPFTMASSSKATLATLESFLKSYPGITYVPPTSPNFSSLQSTYMLDYQKVPLAVVRPKTAEDVAALVSYCTVNSIEFVIRSGGSNIFGVTSVQDALMIDMRDIRYIEVDESKTSAKFGGGVINSDIAEALSKQGLATAIGSVPFVGYVGWSTYGGSNSLGLEFHLRSAPRIEIISLLASLHLLSRYNRLTPGF
jgi:hypothetical protein